MYQNAIRGAKVLKYLTDLLNRLRREKEPVIQEDQLEHIKELINEGNLDRAIEELEKTEKSPEIDEEGKLSCKILRSGILNTKGDFERALKLAKEALEESLKLEKRIQAVDAATNVASNLFRLGRFEEELEVIEQGEELLNSIKRLVSREEYDEKLLHLTNRKGTNYATKGILDKAIKQFKECVKIAEKLGKNEFLAGSLNNLGRTYFLMGEIDLALEQLQRSLLVLRETENQAAITYTLDNLGKIYEFKGELDAALELYQKAKDQYQEIGNKHAIAITIHRIGKIFQIKGDHEQALKQFQEALKLRKEVGNDYETSESLFDLIVLLMEEEKTGEAEKRLKDLEEIEKKNDNKVISQRTRIAEGLLLQGSERAINKAKAQEIFQTIAEEEIIDYQLTIFSMFRLCELLLFELKAYENEEVLHELEQLSKKVQKIAEDNKAVPLIAEAYLLRSKLALLRLDIKRAEELLEQASSALEKHDLKYLIEKISLEKDLLKKEVEKWNELAHRQASMNERFELANIGDKLIPILVEEISQSAKILEVAQEQSFKKELIGFILYKFEKAGIQPFMRNGATVLNRLEEKKFGTFLSISVSLGSEYFTGLYGPLPVTGNPNYESLVYAQLVKDPKSPDPRLKNKNYLIISFVYHKSISKLLMMQREKIEKVFKEHISPKVDINKLSLNTLKTICREIEETIVK
ncbi:MAG: tetratricopeptide repeat protein [Candidatus Heimdallarchaeota archaeon]|nr:tetratricopeptide repeat protein [Candidatus Heimdallarchaeota archaeon]